MRETFGFDFAASGFGLVISFAIPMAIFAVLIPIVRLFLGVFRAPAVLYTLLTFALSLIFGSVLSETWILADEVAFATRVAANSTEGRTSPRSWPNEAASMIYLPGRGIHAND